MPPEEQVSTIFAAGAPGTRPATDSFCLMTDMPAHGCYRLVRAQRNGARVKLIDFSLSDSDSLRHITLHTSEPPCFGVMSNIDLPNITLHVPAEAVEAYREAER